MGAEQSSLNGTVTSCGPSQGISLQFSCLGSNCVDLDGFPNTTCTTLSDGVTLSCSNNIACPGPTNYTSIFTLNQTFAPLSLITTVTQTQNIVLSDFCQNITLTSDGTIGGTNATGIKTGPCSPGSSKSSSSTVKSSTSSSAVRSSLKSSGISSSTVPKSSSSHLSSSSSKTTTSTSNVSRSSSAKSIATSLLSSSSLVKTSSLSSQLSSSSSAKTSSASRLSSSSSFGKSTSSSSRLSSSSSLGKSTSSSSHLASASSKSITSSTPSISSSSSARPKSSTTKGSSTTLPVARRNTKKVSAEDDLLKARQLNQPSHSLTSRALPSPGWQVFSDLFSSYLAGLVNTTVYGDNLVALVDDAICTRGSGTPITSLLGVNLIETCVTAIYTQNALFDPAAEFAGIFGATVLCNMLVAETLPGIPTLTEAICSQPKPCSADLLTDPLNCGGCGNVCATGVCANGACTSNNCTGQTCETFSTPCGPGSPCVCASTTEGTGYCVNGFTACSTLNTCGDSSDCGSGMICAVDTCCGVNVCVGATFCGDSAPAGAAATANAMFSYSSSAGFTGEGTLASGNFLKF